MRQLTIRLYNLPPLPRNSATSPVGSRVILTEMAREFKVDLRYRLANQFDQDQFRQFKQEFSTGQWSVKREMVVETPTNRLFTKDGRISDTSIDEDAHKHLQDVVMGHLGINDAQIIRSSVEKVESLDEYWNWTIIYTLIPRLQPRIKE